MSKSLLYTINIASLAIFLILLFLISVGGWILSIDNFVAIHVFVFRAPVWDAFMNFFTFLGNVSTIILFSAVMMFILYRQKKFWHMVVFGVGVVSTGVLGEIIKNLVTRARPPMAILSETGYSFPSGHALMATVFAVMIIYFFSGFFTRGRARNLFVIASVIMAVAVGASRIYFDVHWLSDVLAGFSLALFWSTLIIIVAMTTGLEKPLSK